MSRFFRTFGDCFLLTSDEKEYLIDKISAVTALTPGTIRSRWGKAFQTGPGAFKESHLTSIKSLLNGIDLVALPDNYVIYDTGKGWIATSKEYAEAHGHGTISTRTIKRARLLGDHFGSDKHTQERFIGQLRYALNVTEKTMRSLFKKPLEDQYFKDFGIEVMEAKIGIGLRLMPSECVIGYDPRLDRNYLVTKTDYAEGLYPWSVKTPIYMASDMENDPTLIGWFISDVSHPTKGYAKGINGEVAFGNEVQLQEAKSQLMRWWIESQGGATADKNE